METWYLFYNTHMYPQHAQNELEHKTYGTMKIMNMLFQKQKKTCRKNVSIILKKSNQIKKNPKKKKGKNLYNRNIEKIQNMKNRNRRNV